MVFLSKTPVPHAGGTLTITPGPERSYQVGLSHTSSTHGFAMYQVAITETGRPLAFVPATGMGQSPVYPRPSILAFVISDAQQLWGRICPLCRTYFRTEHIRGVTVCPYCTFADDAIYMLTDSQLKYLRKFAGEVVGVIEKQQVAEIDLGEATDFPEWTYAEMELQHRFKCTTCNIGTDILGEYGSCPSCGKRNSGEVFHPKLNRIEKELQQSEPDKYPEILNHVVSVFEAMANDLKKILVSIPCHPERRRQIAHQLDFLDVNSAIEKLGQWYAFDLAHGWKNGDASFVDVMFKRRHVFTHNGGRVDQKYLDETKDQSFVLNELIVVKKEEMERLLPLVRKLASNLISDVESIETVHGVVR
jgi:hypothetical protein